MFQYHSQQRIVCNLYFSHGNGSLSGGNTVTTTPFVVRNPKKPPQLQIKTLKPTDGHSKPQLHEPHAITHAPTAN